MQSICDIPRCQHVRVNGVQCGSPALRHQRFCYFHRAWRESHHPNPKSRAQKNGLNFDLPPLEDANSIQMALMQIMRLILSQQVDAKMAGLLLYALQTASGNLKHLTLEPDWQKVVVNPAAVRYSPLEVSGDAPVDLEKENELLYERLEKGPDAGESAARQAESAAADATAEKPGAEAGGRSASQPMAPPRGSKKPCATVGAAVQAVLRSRHPLPTCPEDWEELKMADTAAWLLSFTSLLYPREEWQKVKDDPEKFKDLPAPRVDRSSP